MKVYKNRDKDMINGFITLISPILLAFLLIKLSIELINQGINPTIPL